jgi:CheY-like chemotaxis protein
MQMPEMDGLTCTEIIRSENLSNNPYIIGQTANVYSEDKERCFEAGMNGFIAKPFKKVDLSKALSEFIIKSY